MSVALPYLGIIACICLSAFFSGSEIAYASVNAMRLKKTADSGDKRSNIGYYICSNYDNALCTILVGNNLVNIASSSIATVIAVDLAGGSSGAAYATVIMTVLILIFGEIMPKILAKEHCDAFVLMVAMPLRFLMIITIPVVKVVNFIIDRVSVLWGGRGHEIEYVTEDELVTIIETVEDEGVIDEDRSNLLQSAIQFSDITVQEILTPRVDMLTIDIEQPMTEIIEICAQSSYSRIPVIKERLDNVIGVCYLNHFFKTVVDDENVKLEELLTPACFIHRSARLPIVLSELRKRKNHIAVVVDDYGGTMGIVTVEDILEELVGEIWDENDEVVEEFVMLGDNLCRVQGSMNVHDMLDELDVSTRDLETDSTTVGGWCVEMLGGFPSEGQSFTYKNLTVTVESLEDYRVTQVMIKAEPVVEDERWK